VSAAGSHSSGKAESGVQTEEELTRCSANHYCYVKSFENSYIILLLLWVICSL
jgi:hypothetical protein